MKEQISSQEWILLSSYLDGELNPREKTRVEALLQSRPDVQEAYLSLQRTKNVLRHAPRRRVPRNFTLSAKYARQPRSFRLIPTLRLSSAVAALMSVFLIVSQLLPAFSPAMMRTAAPEAGVAQLTEENAAAESLMLEMAPAETSPGSGAEPPVVYWGGPPPPPVDGTGGAGFAPGCPDGRCGGAPDFAYGMGGGGGGDASPLDLQPQAEKAPAFPLATPQASERNLKSEPLTGSGPILGIGTADEKNMILGETAAQNLPLDQELAVSDRQEKTGLFGLPPALVAGIALLTVAVGLFIAAIILSRVSRT